MVKRISFPAMGWSKIAFKSLFKHIPGVEIFEPPEVTRDIVQLGAKNSPEFVCHPFKVTLGEFMSMYDKYGVDTFVQAIDCGPCRFGFYAPVQERIMKDLGYNITIIPIQQGDLLTFQFLNTFYQLTSVQGKVMRMVDIVRGVRMFLIKTKYIDDIVTLEHLIRCREKHKDDTTKTVVRLMKMLDEEDDGWDIHSFDQKIKEEFRRIPIKRDIQPLRVTVGGEMHVLWEPFVNMDIMKRFGDEGIEVHPGHTLYDWVTHKLHLNFRRHNLERYGDKYVPMDIGGEARWIIGEYIKTQAEGFDGFVHIYPFTCMPETTVRGIIEAQSPDPFYMPIQFYSFDEHTGFEGMRTRIEAFIDLMKSNRENNPKFQNKYLEPPEIAACFDRPPKTGNNILDFFNVMSKPVLDIFNPKNGQKEHTDKPVLTKPQPDVPLIAKENK